MKDLSKIEVQPPGGGGWIPADNHSEVPEWVQEAVTKTPHDEDSGQVQKNGAVWRWSEF